MNRFKIKLPGQANLFEKFNSPINNIKLTSYKWFLFNDFLLYNFIKLVLL
jgi:hypothetical protein